MQTTLIGLAIAFILALVAALVGPFVVDWNNYRAAFEQEASRLAGIDVRVHGKIDGRLLPSPQLSLSDVEIGRAGAGGVRAGSLDIEFALGSLMRGEWRAAEMKLAGPSIHLGLDASGRLQAPSLALNFDPQALSIDRLSIVNGTITLSDAASGGRIDLEKIWFNGDVRSLLGPVKGEGAFSYRGTLFPYRIAAGRYAPDGTIRLRLNVDPSDVALSLESEGTVFLAGLEPRFEGTVGITRPVGIARGASPDVTPPWRAGGKIKVSQKQALMEQVEFSYGSGDDAMRLFGTANFNFGAQPRFDGVVSGRQIDLDRMLAGANPAEHRPPVAVIRELVSAAAAAVKPELPVSLGVGIDLVTLGGATIQNLRGDLSSRDGGWLLDRFEFRAPGLTQVRLSGRVALDDGTVAFRGPADVSSADPRALAGWLQGASLSGVVAPRPMRARGDLTIGANKIAIERMRAEFAREAVTGKLVYQLPTDGKPARLDAELNAPQLDIDAVQSFASAVMKGAKFERPREMAIALDIGRATWAGYEAGEASLRMRLGAQGLELDKLSVADFGGASLSARGTIALNERPGGRIVLDLDARDLSAVVAAAGKFVPDFADRLREAAPSLAPAKLQSTLSVESTAAAVNANINISGTAGTLVVKLGGDARTSSPQFKLSALADANISVKGRLDARDNLLLARLIGIDHVLAIGKGPGAMSFSAERGAASDVRLAGRWTGKDVDIGFDGTAASLIGDPKASVTLKVAHADASGLRGGLAALAEPLPVTLTSKVGIAGATVHFEDIDGRVARVPVRGRLTMTRGAVDKVAGELSFGSLDLAALAAAGAGFPPQIAQSSAWSWPGEPFGAPQLDGYAGAVTISAPRARLTEDWTLRGFKAVARFDDKSFALEDISAGLGGGRFGGALTMRRGVQGIATEAKLTLQGVDAGSLTPDAVRAPVAGRLDLTLAAEGSGRSPATLIGSLNGSGTLMLEGARLSGLDPRVFEAVAQISDRATETDTKKLADLAGRALDAGNLSVRKASADISLSAGQLRISNMNLPAEGADASLSGRIDLNDGTMDVRIALTGAVDSGMKPNLFIALRGPVTAPERSIDASALTGWLTMKAIERHARELKEIEAKRRREEEVLRKLESAAPPPAAPATQAPSAPPAAPSSPPGGRPQQSSSAPANAPVLPPPVTIAPAPQPPKVEPRAQSAPPPGLSPAAASQ